MTNLFLIGLVVVLCGVPLMIVCMYHVYQSTAWKRVDKPKINPTAANTVIKVVGKILLS